MTTFFNYFFLLIYNNNNNKIMASQMYDYAKKLLLKLRFDSVLFHKELEKAAHYLSYSEYQKLDRWARSCIVISNNKNSTEKHVLD